MIDAICPADGCTMGVFGSSSYAESEGWVWCGDAEEWRCPNHATRTERLTENGREWRDRAIEAEGLIDHIGAMRERVEADALRWQVLADLRYIEARKWRRVALDTADQRDEALAMLRYEVGE